MLPLPKPTGESAEARSTGSSSTSSSPASRMCGLAPRGVPSFFSLPLAYKNMGGLELQPLGSTAGAILVHFLEPQPYVYYIFPGWF